ncbi:hypothetical protein FJT64_005031 [Amphibalanus amphitrite]|uniref:Uncharacterized protein n=1 Tax=Amphibalanus amphitrite TaxID=1232801 RepID=A0A6A4VMV0_AMPAM|nr:hypothetical protein FJT64_005031 [Amphibalanus amphitrite]
MKEISPDMYSEAAVWTDLGMIMGLEEDVKEHVLHKIRHTAKKYAQTMINVEPADKDGDELVALPAYGRGATLDDLKNEQSSVSVQSSRLNVQRASSSCHSRRSVKLPQSLQLMPCFIFRSVDHASASSRCSTRRP